MLSIPGVEESRTKARTNRPDYIQEALDRTAELIREASGSGDLVVKIDLKTLLSGLDQDKHSLALAHLRLELNLRGYLLKDYVDPVLSDNGAYIYDTKKGFYVYWGGERRTTTNQSNKTYRGIAFRAVSLYCYSKEQRRKGR